MEKLSLTSIKPGDIYYVVNYDRITRYEYLCPMPRENKTLPPDGKYFILINRTTQEPVRIYCKTLETDLDNSFKTYDEAKLKVIENLEKRVKDWKERAL